MFTSLVQRRVIYAETDRMGYLYYGNYPSYYEVGRVEALRELGTSYRILEDSGILMPVIQLHVEYLSPAYYDDLLNIKTFIPSLPSARMEFLYEISNEEGFVINRGSTTLVFTDIVKRKPVRPPQWFVQMFIPFFNE